MGKASGPDARVLRHDIGEAMKLWIEDERPAEPLRIGPYTEGGRLGSLCVVVEVPDQVGKLLLDLNQFRYEIEELFSSMYQRAGGR